ncbi:DUF2459 domain-containing protein [Sulfitobacter sp. S190]|uniref:DUF2459 domain-containing protein n=1 Tax=Sulfitobacter sp. S190 TaxID=2867022 RepID=UPI0021A74E16|nr:DUF2459 domain-containing protein [Sulfitobacter sp. S190]UWR22305.1 DUF2459 domain-containing protein [Sulfitobacter sp. S190]
MAGALDWGARTSDQPIGKNPIYLLNGPIHYDFVLPLDGSTRAAMAELLPDQPGAEHLIVGYGARTFYTTVGGYSDVTPQAILRGIFGDSAVMRLDVAGPLPPAHGMRTLLLNDAQYADLLAEIVGSFASSEPVLIAGFTPTDRFFPAFGRFNILRTCNVWVGDTLRAAGVRFGRWTPLPASVSLSHRLYHTR